LKSQGAWSYTHTHIEAHAVADEPAPLAPRGPVTYHAIRDDMIREMESAIAFLATRIEELEARIRDLEEK